MRFKQIYLLLLICLSILIISGCGGISDKEIEGLTKKDILVNGIDRYMKLSNFEVLEKNCTEEECTAEVAYKLAYTKSLDEILADIDKKSEEDVHIGMNVIGMGISLGDFKSGDGLSFKKSLAFQKSEDRWQLGIDGLSDGEIERQVRRSLNNKENYELFEVIRVHKVNGLRSQRNQYQAEVEYDLRFLIDVNDLARQLMEERKSFEEKMMSTVQVKRLVNKYGHFKVGEVKKGKEVFHFIKTEKGWTMMKAEIADNLFEDLLF